METAQAHGKYVTPEALEEILASTKFEDFYTNLEYGAHNAIPQVIRGDFFKVTAPYGRFSIAEHCRNSSLLAFLFSLVDTNRPNTPDPLFFLHHTQLDRLWHRWQLIDPETRIGRLSGNAIQDNTAEEEELGRMLDVGALGRQIPVAHALNTRKWGLCYAY